MYAEPGKGAIHGAKDLRHGDVYLRLGLNGKPLSGVESQAIRALSTYHWPGNVRELRNVIERAVIVASDLQIGLQELPPFVTRGPKAETAAPDSSDELALRVGTTVEQAERNLILKTLEATGHNKTRAAEILGISLKTLHNKLKKYRQP